MFCYNLAISEYVRSCRGIFVSNWTQDWQEESKNSKFGSSEEDDFGGLVAADQDHDGSIRYTMWFYWNNMLVRILVPLFRCHCFCYFPLYLLGCSILHASLHIGNNDWELRILLTLRNLRMFCKHNVVYAKIQIQSKAFLTKCMLQFPCMHK